MFCFCEVRILVEPRGHKADSDALVPVALEAAGPCPTQIDQDFQRVFNCLENMDTEGAKGMLKELQSKLRNTKGSSSREKGGWKYNSVSILDAVLLADNLRPLTSETDLLPEVVKQWGGSDTTVSPSPAVV